MSLKQKILKIIDRFSNQERIQELDRNLTLLAEQNSSLHRRLELLERKDPTIQHGGNAHDEYVLKQLSIIHSEHGNRLKLLNKSIWKIVSKLNYPGEKFDEDALNGQFSKQLIFDAIFSKYRFDHIIETGTYLGASTKFFAKQGLPVLTIESVQKHIDIAKETCGGFDNVEFVKGSSDEVLERLLSKKYAGNFNFYYLDAHWEDHIPLHREIELIAQRNPNSIMMIDDFKVPTDLGYAYDRYGTTSLNLSYIADLIEKFDLHMFFPAIDASKDYCTIDIIQPRGTMVVTADKKLAKVLNSLECLMMYDTEGLKLNEIL